MGLDERDDEPRPDAQADSGEAPTVPIPPVDAELDAPAPAAAGAAAAQPTPPRRPVLRARFVVAGVLLVGLAAYAVLDAERWIHAKAVDEARRRGIELTLGAVELDWERVKLRHCRFGLIGVPGVEGSVELVQLDLDGLTPLRIGARGVRLDVTGSAAALAMAISEWTKNHPSMMRIPAKATGVDLRWRTDRAEREWLVIDDAVIDPRPGGGIFTAERVRVFDVEVGFDNATLRQDATGGAVTASRVRVGGIELGSVGTAWSGDLSHVQLGFGEQDLAQAPVVIDVAYGEPEPRATITLRPTELDRLAAPLGVALPVEGVTASGTAELYFAPAPNRGAVRGKLQATFEGYAPPVPKAIRSFVFGQTTHLRTELTLSADRKRVELSDTHVEHGAISLDGRGHIARHRTHAAISLDLAGSLRCTDLAEAAARSELGGLAGGLLGGAARLAVRGSVGIELAVQADTRNLAAARLDKTIGVGCGLKSLGDLPLPELPKLPDFSRLGREEP